MEKIKISSLGILDEQKFKKIQENGKWISTNEKYFQITNIKKLSI